MVPCRDGHKIASSTEAVVGMAEVGVVRCTEVVAVAETSELAGIHAAAVTTGTEAVGTHAVLRAATRGV